MDSNMNRDGMILRDKLLEWLRTKSEVTQTDADVQAVDNIVARVSAGAQLECLSIEQALVLFNDLSGRIYDGTILGSPLPQGSNHRQEEWLRLSTLSVRLY